MKSFLAIFKIPDLRNKIIFTIGMLILYRFGTYVTIPGVNPVAVAHARPPGQGFMDIVNVFSGGALFKLSVFSLGIMPYISASIIMNLMTVVIPPLARLQREGEEGRKAINKYTRYGTILLCAVQAFFILQWAMGPTATSHDGQKLVSPDIGKYMFMFIGLLSMTTGTVFLMWVGEQITERGIGNGVSLIIFGGIIAQLPQMVYKTLENDSVETFAVIILLIVFMILIAFTVILQSGVRKVPIQYGKKMQGRRMVQAQSQSLPFKLNSANVMPIIFASSLIMFPQTIFGSLGIASEWLNPFAADWYKQMPYYVIYTTLIIFFSYFYTAIQINPQDLSENLKKYGGFVPGIRPGSHTKEFIEFVLNRIILPGAIFLAALALAPYFIIDALDLETDQNTQQLAYTFGGTSLLIIVGVALDTLKQVESQLLMRNYEGFMKKGKIKGRR